MSTTNPGKKQYSTALSRNLRSALINFIQTEFPSFGGPKVISFFVEELLKLLQKLTITKDKIQIGQILWLALDKNNRVTAKNPRFKPIILTLVHQDDIIAHCNNKSQREITTKVIAWLFKEAFSQGTLLSVRDISLILSKDNSYISRLRVKYEKENNTIVPHQGSEHDMGSTVSHKSIIIHKVIRENKDPLTVAREVNHSQRAVDRYLKDFYRTKLCKENNKSLEETALITNLSKQLIKEYWQLTDKVKDKRLITTNS